MFFDSLGQTFKDGVIFLLIVFTFVLSIYVINLNSSVEFWYSNCKSTVNKEQSQKHMSNSTAVMLASIFMGAVILIILYTMYQYWSKGRIVGLNSYGRRFR